MQQSTVPWKVSWGMNRTVVLTALALAPIHFGLAKLARALSYQDGSTVIWFSSGVFLVAVLLLGCRIWPALLLVDWLNNYLLFYPNNPSFSFLIAVIDITDPLVTAFLIRRFIKRSNPLERSQDIFKFVLLLMVNPVFSATFAMTALCAIGVTAWADFASAWRTWLMSVIAGMLIVAPVGLSWFHSFSVQNNAAKIDFTKPNPMAQSRSHSILELICLVLLVIAVSRAAFWSGYPIEYMMIPLLIWSTFRFGQRESTLLVLLISIISIFGTAHGFGSFARGSVSLSLGLLQSFICVLSSTTLVLGAVLAENRRANTKLKQANDELEHRVEERTAELREAKRLADRANQAKSEFLANMSHELRTPLNGILGYAQILRKKSLNPAEQKGIEIIYQCGSYLLTLINDVLDLSKIEARRMELFPKEFHFPSFLEGVIEMCRIKAEQKGITFSYQPDVPLPDGIHADEKRLRQVLINLLSNAIKFTDQGGVTFAVRIEPAIDSNAFPTSAGQNTKLLKIRFQIEDTGVGLASEQLEKIFLPFEQVGSAVKQTEGTGLGLAISQEIVRLMGSTIEVESEPGKGSIFRFDVVLPEAREWRTASRKMQFGEITGFEGEPRTILVVDDLWENRSVLRNLLEPIGFEIVEANHGEEGLTIAAQIRPDLIVTDLAMPIMDGLTMVSHLRQSAELCDVPIIASSASVFELNRQEAINAGCDDFVPKPVQADELLEKLQHQLQLQWIFRSQALSSKPVVLPSTATEPILPPPAELVSLYEAVQRCRVVAIQAEAQRIRQLDARYCAFADQVSALADEFEMDAIAQLIQPHLSNALS